MFEYVFVWFHMCLSGCYLFVMVLLSYNRMIASRFLALAVPVDQLMEILIWVETILLPIQMTISRFRGNSDFDW